VGDQRVKYTFRIPSKSIQYGFAEVEVELGGPARDVGAYYHQFVKDFQQGEADAKTLASSGKVDAVLPAPEYDEPVTPEQAERLITEELGATDITDVMNEDVEEEAPEWEAPPPPPSDDDWDF
jgi:hypothetical protein